MLPLPEMGQSQNRMYQKVSLPGRFRTLSFTQAFEGLLILTGAEDHFIPMKIHHLQAAALVNARSVTERIFTRAEQAQNHCQVGNMGLALETMAAWTGEKATAALR